MNQSGFKAESEYNSESKCQHTKEDELYCKKAIVCLKQGYKLKYNPKVQPHYPNKHLHTLKYYA